MSFILVGFSFTDCSDSESALLCSALPSSRSLLSVLSPVHHSVGFARSLAPSSVRSVPSFLSSLALSFSLVLLSLLFTSLAFCSVLFCVLLTLGGARLDCFWAPHTYIHTLSSLSLSRSPPESGWEEGREGTKLATAASSSYCLSVATAVDHAVQTVQ